MAKFKCYQVWYIRPWGSLWRTTSQLGIIKARTDKEANSKLSRKTFGMFGDILFLATQEGSNPNY